VLAPPEAKVLSARPIVTSGEPGLPARAAEARGTFAAEPNEDPARALVCAARGADRLLLLRPAHGGTFHHLGRTAPAVLRDARCPVEVLAPPPPGRLPGAPMVIERVGELLR
jgi:hypothetical protein